MPQHKGITEKRKGTKVFSLSLQPRVVKKVDKVAAKQNVSRSHIVDSTLEKKFK